MRLHYKDQLVNTLQWNNRVWLWQQ